MEAEDAKRLKELESENGRLKRLLTEAHLDIEALKVGFGVNRPMLIRLLLKQKPAVFLWKA